MDVLLLAVGGVLAVFNFTQAALDRQLVRREPRPPGRLRRESIGAGVAMTGVSGVGLGALVSTPLVAAVGIVLVVAGMATVAIGR